MRIIRTNRHPFERVGQGNEYYSLISSIQSNQDRYDILRYTIPQTGTYNISVSVDELTSNALGGINYYQLVIGRDRGGQLTDLRGSYAKSNGDISISLSDEFLLEGDQIYVVIQRTIGIPGIMYRTSGGVVNIEQTSGTSVPIIIV